MTTAQEFAAELEQAGYRIFWDEVWNGFCAAGNSRGASVKFSPDDVFLAANDGPGHWLHNLDEVRRHLGVEQKGTSS